MPASLQHVFGLVVNIIGNLLQYQKVMTTDDITHCVYGRSRRSTTSCSLHFCFLRTGQTAVASIPRLGGCRDYVRCVHVFACSVSSRVQPTYLTTCPYRVCIAVTRLGPPGFSPEVVRSLSTCSYECIHEVLLDYSPTPASKRKGDTERERTTHVNISENSFQHFISRSNHHQ